jgi:hypothetical protein
MGAMLGIPETFTAKSAADLSSYQWVFVKYSSTSTDANKVVEVCASGVPCGILILGATAGRDMAIIPLNGQPAKLVASAAIAVGDMVTITTGGEGVTTTTDGARIYFIADEAATASGGDDIITGITCNFMRGA